MTRKYRLDDFSTLDLQRELNRRILRQASTLELRRELIRREVPSRPLARPQTSSPAIRPQEESYEQRESTSLDQSSRVLAIVYQNYGPGKPRTIRTTGSDSYSAEAS